MKEHETGRIIKRKLIVHFDIEEEEGKSMTFLTVSAKGYTKNV